MSKESRTDFDQGLVLFSLPHSIQTIYGTHLAYHMDAISLVVKLSQLKANHFPPPNSEAKNYGAISLLAPTFHGMIKHRDFNLNLCYSLLPVVWHLISHAHKFMDMSETKIFIKLLTCCTLSKGPVFYLKITF
jgi:hypothetical protein